MLYVPTIYSIYRQTSSLIFNPVYRICNALKVIIIYGHLSRLNLKLKHCRNRCASGAQKVIVQLLAFTNSLASAHTRVFLKYTHKTYRARHEVLKYVRCVADFGTFLIFDCFSRPDFQS